MPTELNRQAAAADAALGPRPEIDVTYGASHAVSAAAKAREAAVGHLRDFERKMREVADQNLAPRGHAVAVERIARDLEERAGKQIATAIEGLEQHLATLKARHYASRHTLQQAGLHVSGQLLAQSLAGLNHLEIRGLLESGDSDALVGVISAPSWLVRNWFPDAADRDALLERAQVARLMNERPQIGDDLVISKLWLEHLRQARAGVDRQTASVGVRREEQYES